MKQVIVTAMHYAVNLMGLCLPAALLTGCEEHTTHFPVAGKVLIDGEPLPSGSIRFVPEKGRPASGKILADGTFDLAETSLSSDPRQTGVAPGKYRVAVSASRVVDENADEVEWLAPRKYADFRTSDLAVEIDGPRDELVVDLTWDGNEVESGEDRDVATERSNADANEQEASPEK
jgi:hypothetical protein